MRKIINSETRKYEENVTDTLILDATPTVNSFNTVTSDGVARAIAGASGEVPVVTEDDNGKILTAIYDEGGPAVEWAEPAVDQTYDAESTNAQSGVAVAEAIGTVNAVPASAVEDAGKVLTVDNAGSAAWAEAQGGDVVVVTYDTTKVAEISATIKDAIAAGKPVVMYNPTEKVTAPMTSCTVNGDTVTAQFCIMKGTSTTAKTYTSYQIVNSTLLFDNTGTVVPAVSLNTDAGKVLTAGSAPGTVSWQRVYPDITGNAGKVLAVNSGATGTEWVTPAAPSGGSDEWWGGDPGSDVSGPDGTIRLRFKDTTYDPRNDPDSTFLAKFNSITKVSDGVYDFACKNLKSSIFNNKYLADNEFVVLRFRLGGGESVLCGSIFYGCTGLRAVYNVADTGSGRSWAFAFYGCTNLVDVRLGYAPDSIGMRFKATSVKEMFENCYRLKTLKAEIVGSGVDCDRMCLNCYALEIGPTLRAVASKTSMMFEGCSSLVRFLSPFVADSTTYVSTHGVACDDMFDGCTSLQSLDGLCLFFAGSFISNASSMFAGCSALTKAPYIRLESSAVCRSMFDGCTVLERPPRMDWANISDMWRMFSKCQSMTTLDDGSSWYSYQLNPGLTDVHEMFYKCIGVRDQSPEFVYQALSQVATTYNDCFTDCGIVWNNPSLANIPSSWGGTGA